MDEQALQYSRHARKRMATNHVTEDEVEAIVWYPAWRRQSLRGRVEHFGYSDDGRLFSVVTDRYEELVITVVEHSHRERKHKNR
jgi:hypothetical protein